jgi:hypothetical protein
MSFQTVKYLSENQIELYRISQNVIPRNKTTGTRIRHALSGEIVTAVREWQRWDNDNGEIMTAVRYDSFKLETVFDAAHSEWKTSKTMLAALASCQECNLYLCAAQIRLRFTCINTRNVVRPRKTRLGTKTIRVTNLITSFLCLRFLLSSFVPSFLPTHFTTSFLSFPSLVSFLPTT